MKTLALALLPLMMGAATMSWAQTQMIKPARVLFLVGGAYHNYDELPAALVQKLHDQ
jgi:hypothetical protein